MTNRYCKIDGLDCIDPGKAYEYNHANGGPLDFWGLANSISIEIGKEPGVAWLLVPRATYTAVEAAKNSTHTISWIDGTTTTTFANLVLANATCMGIDGDSKAPYLLELRDVRQRLLNAGGVTKRYNESDAMPKGTYSALGDTLRRYRSSTLNAGAIWTWQAMFADLWGFLPAAAGGVPTLPYTLPHNPEAWRFQGESAWDAVHMVLNALQSAIVCNPYTGVLSVVALGTAQSGWSAQEASLSTNRLIDWNPANDLGKSRKPATVRVLFRGRKRTPNTVEQLDQAWEAWTPVDTATGITGAEAGRIVSVNSDLFSERDENDAVLNQAALDATAASLANRIANRYTISGEHERIECPGIVTWTAPLGEEVHRLVYRDFGDDDGTRTEIWGLTHWGDATHATTHRRKESTRLAIVRLSEATWQQTNGWAYVPYCKIVRYFVASDSYASNAANETDITLYHPTGYAGNPTTYGASVRSLHTSSGLWPTKSGNTDDVWAVWNDVSERWESLAPYEDHWRFVLTQDVTKGGSGSAKLRLFSGGVWITTTLSFTVYDSSELGPFENGKYGVAKRYGDSIFFEILTCQTTPLKAYAFLAGDMCPTDDDDEYIVQVTGAAYYPNCEAFTPAKVTDPRHHRGPDGAKVTLIRKKCPGQDEEWEVEDVELTRYCAVVGIEDRDSCLVAAGLRLGGEWCPSDEPVEACPTVEYTDCESTLPACDTAWTFEPLFACCGQNVAASVSGQRPSSPSQSMISARGPGPLPGQFLP